MTDISHTLFVSDLDGTLLNEHSLVSAESAQILGALIARRGLLFTVATARTPATAVPLLANVGLRLPMVVMEGAAMWHGMENRFVDVQTIDERTVAAVSNIFARHGLVPFVYRCHRHRSLVTHHHGALSDQERAFVTQRLDSPLKRWELDSPTLGRDSGDQAMFLFAMNDHDRLKKVYDEVRASVPCEIVFYNDPLIRDAALLEIYAAHCTKAAAVARLAARLVATHIVAYGDNVNDLPMMRAATHAVAVENAMPQVKAAAHEVIGRNTDNAVAKHIFLMCQEAINDEA